MTTKIYTLTLNDALTITIIDSKIKSNGIGTTIGTGSDIVVGATCSIGLIIYITCISTTGSRIDRSMLTIIDSKIKSNGIGTTIGTGSDIVVGATCSVCL